MNVLHRLDDLLGRLIYHGSYESIRESLACSFNYNLTYVKHNDNTKDQLDDSLRQVGDFYAHSSTIIFNPHERYCASIVSYMVNPCKLLNAHFESAFLSVFLVCSNLIK